MVDTGASYHATPQKYFFSSYESENFDNVKMKNCDTYKIVGICDIPVKTNVGCKIILKDLRHIPDLWLNLMSPYMLDEGGFDIHFGKGTGSLLKCLL